MQPDRSRWQQWARFLQRWGLSGIASYMLDAGGPLAVLAAQALYLGQPFASRGGTHNQLQALATLFENTDEMHAFAAFLREDQQP